MGLSFSDFWLNIIINSNKCFITKGGREKFFYFHSPSLDDNNKEGFFIIVEHKNLKNYDFIERELMEKIFLEKDEFTPKSFFQILSSFYDDIEKVKTLSADAYPYVFSIINDSRIKNLDDGFKGKRFQRYFKNMFYNNLK